MARRPIYSRSINLELCLNILQDFEAVNPKYKYRSDLEIFIGESKLESVGLNKVNETGDYPEPSELTLQLSHKDVVLDFFLSRQDVVLGLNSGDELEVKGDCCHHAKGQPVLKFSQKFISETEPLRQKGYTPKSARVRFIVYWQKEDTDREIGVVLPEIYFERV